MKEALFIGGPMDGKSQELGSGFQAVLCAGGSDYLLRPVNLNGCLWAFYTDASMTLEESMRHVFDILCSATIEKIRSLHAQ